MSDCGEGLYVQVGREHWEEKKARAWHSRGKQEGDRRCRVPGLFWWRLEALECGVVSSMGDGVFQRARDWGLVFEHVAHASTIVIA